MIPGVSRHVQVQSPKLFRLFQSSITLCLTVGQLCLSTMRVLFPWSKFFISTGSLSAPECALVGVPFSNECGPFILCAFSLLVPCRYVFDLLLFFNGSFECFMCAVFMWLCMPRRVPFPYVRRRQELIFRSMYACEHVSVWMCAKCSLYSFSEPW